MGLRVSETEEVAVLDATQHGETACVFEDDTSFLQIPPEEISLKKGSIEDILPSSLTLETK